METPESNSTGGYDRIDQLLSRLPQELRDRWEGEVESLDVSDAIARLEGVVAARGELESHGHVQFSEEVEHDPVLKEGLERTIALLESSHGDPELFLGDGAVAEVYRFRGDPRICIKTVKDELMYKKGNTIHQEGAFLEQLVNLEVDGVRTPKLYFYHDTLRMRSLGMETIEGASLSRIMGGEVDFPEIHDIGVDDFFRSLRRYVDEMHGNHVYHRDLYPRNIMIDRATLKPRVIDFGKARLGYFDQDIGDSAEVDSELLKYNRQTLDKFLRGEKVDIK
jgi:tRNA A-37 threonylcarbamoyl transferase component Bud32